MAVSATVTNTWDDEQLKQDRLRLLQSEMKRRGVGALYLGDGVFRRYVLNLNVPGGKMFVPAEGEAIAFVRRRDMGMVTPHHERVELPLTEGASDDAGRSLAAAMADLMRQHGMAGESLGVDSIGTSPLLDLIQGGMQIVDAAPLIEHAWTVKTPDEVQIYRTIGDQYARTMSAFRDAIRPGVTENELAAVVVSTWYAVGGEDIAQLNVCAGDNMNPWRRWPTDRQVASGEFVGIDLHGRGINGMRGDASRTFFVGDQPSAEQSDLYRRAYDYLVGAMDVFRAGRSIVDVMASVPPVPEPYRAQQANYNMAHGCGMGSSGYPHIDPRRPAIDDVLEANQVLAVECYFGEVGSQLAVKLEEQIVVRDGEPEVLGAHMPYDERFVR